MMNIFSLAAVNTLILGISSYTFLKTRNREVCNFKMSRHLLPVALRVRVEFCLTGSLLSWKKRFYWVLLVIDIKINYCSDDSSGIWRNHPNQILQTGVLGILLNVVKISHNGRNRYRMRSALAEPGADRKGSLLLGDRTITSFKIFILNLAIVPIFKKILVIIAINIQSY